MARRILEHLISYYGKLGEGLEAIRAARAFC